MAIGANVIEARVSVKLYHALMESHYRNLKVLIGRLLTIGDGIARDEVQRKAIKDLIEDATYKQMGYQRSSIEDYCRHLAGELGEAYPITGNCESGRASEVNPFVKK